MGICPPQSPAAAAAAAAGQEQLLPGPWEELRRRCAAMEWLYHKRADVRLATNTASGCSPCINMWHCMPGLHHCWRPAAVPAVALHVLVLAAQSHMPVKELTTSSNSLPADTHASCPITVLPAPIPFVGCD
jgi:hypothetical protein